MASTTLTVQEIKNIVNTVTKESYTITKNIDKETIIQKIKNVIFYIQNNPKNIQIDKSMQDINIYDFMNDFDTIQKNNTNNNIYIHHQLNTLYLIQKLIEKSNTLKKYDLTSKFNTILSNINTFYKLIKNKDSIGTIPKNAINSGQNNNQNYKILFNSINKSIDELASILTISKDLYIEVVDDTYTSINPFNDDTPIKKVISEITNDNSKYNVKIKSEIVKVNISSSLDNFNKIYIIHIYNIYNYTKLLNDHLENIKLNNETNKANIEKLKSKINELYTFFDYSKKDKFIYLNSDYNITYNASSPAPILEFENAYNQILNFLNLHIYLLKFPKIEYYENGKSVFNSWGQKDVNIFSQYFSSTTYQNVLNNTNDDQFKELHSILINNFYFNDNIINNSKTYKNYLINIILLNSIYLLNIIKTNSNSKKKIFKEKIFNLFDTYFYIIINNDNENMSYYKNKYLEIYNTITKGSNLTTFQNQSNNTSLNSAIDTLITNLSTQNLESMDHISTLLRSMKNNSIQYITKNSVTFSIEEFVKNEITNKIISLNPTNKNYHDKAIQIFTLFKNFLKNIINIKIQNNNINICQYRESIFTTNSFTVRGICTTEFCNIQNILFKTYNNIMKSPDLVNYNTILTKNSNTISKFNQLLLSNGSFQKVLSKFILNIKNKTKLSTSNTYIVFKRLIIFYVCIYVMNKILGLVKVSANVLSRPEIPETPAKVETVSTVEKVASTNNNYSLAKSMISSQNQSLEKNKEARAYIHALLTTINDLIPKITRRQIPALVNETKKEINKLLKNKSIRVSNTELSSIVNEILSEQTKNVNV